MVRLVIAAALTLSLIYASGSYVGAYPPQESAKSRLAASTLPLLPPGNHLGVIRGFNGDNPPRLEARLDHYMERAVSAGMRIGRIHMAWNELEPEPGVFDDSALEEALEEMESLGLKPFITLAALDGGSYAEVPSDLQDPDDPTRLRHGMRLDDPVVVARYKKLLEWAVPQFSAHGVWGISVANEPGGLYEDESDQFDSLKGFVAAARTCVQAMAPEIAVTLTLTTEEALQPPAYVTHLLSVCDVLCFNYYNVDPSTGRILDRQKIRTDFAKLVALAGKRALVVQEAGCPGGYRKNSLLNSSTRTQDEFFKVLYDVQRNTPTLRAVFVFQLVDWSPETANIYREAFEEFPELPPEFVDAFIESIETIGLVRFPSGAPRPAWRSFLKELKRRNR